MDHRHMPYASSRTLKIKDPCDIREVILEHKLRFLVELKQPLVLISQIQRSGGTLLCQLLDGHSQLHVHPSELHIGRPNKYEWPSLDLGLPHEQLFESVREKPVLEHTQLGYQKVSSAEAEFDPEYRDRVLPFIFDAALQKEIFLECLKGREVESQRHVLDCYVTSYFNAWLDYQGMYRNADQVKYWVAFAARLLTKTGNMNRFIADYPDGATIAIIRDPISWFASARRHSEEYAEVDKALKLWKDSAGAILDNMKRFPGRTLLIRFEDLVSDTASLMRTVLTFLGLDLDPCALRPTFNGLDIPSDSSFGSYVGVDKAATDRSATVGGAIRSRIDSATRDLYEELANMAAR